MTEREDVEFEAEGGVKLGGWLLSPAGSGPHPAITMAHGYAGVKEHGLERFARVFADDGFVVLVHDHRGFGASGGEPRQDVDPWRQIADWRRAISFLESRDEVDSRRIGLWGTSYAGGHAIVLGATDRRLRCVVAQVPTISGYEQGRRRIAPDDTAALEDAFAEDERAQARGEPPRYQAIVSADPVPERTWENTVTLRSTRAARMYEPGVWIGRVSPTPLLMVIALGDTITLTDLGLAAYERALEPKRLELIPGGHFHPYVSSFPQSSGAARAWFREHLS
jgi:uncharacterized protein